MSSRVKRTSVSPKHGIVKGDRVRVIRGNHRDMEGTVLRILGDENRVVVEGVNMRKRHQRPSAANPDGGIVTFEAPIHISNVMLVDPASGEAEPGPDTDRGGPHQGTHRGEERQPSSEAKVVENGTLTGSSRVERDASERRADGKEERTGHGEAEKVAKRWEGGAALEGRNAREEGRGGACGWPLAAARPAAASALSRARVPRLTEQFGWKNLHQVPRIEKITMNCGLGEASKNRSCSTAWWRRCD